RRTTETNGWPRGCCRRVSWLRRWTEKRPLTNFTPINIDFIEAGSVGPVVMLGPVAKSFQYLLTDPRQFDILQSGPSWRGANAIRSIETARVHHAARRRGCRVAACRACAAVGDASGRVPPHPIARGICGTSARLPPRPKRRWLYRGRKPHDRIPLG